MFRDENCPQEVVERYKQCCHSVGFYPKCLDF